MAQNLKLEKVFQERTNLKHSSIISYTNGLLAFEKDTGVTPERVLDLSLPEIEDLLEGFVRRNKQKYAPKWLNVVYSSVVKWLVINRKIKNSHELRDIEFEKAKRKVAAMSENPIETYMIKNMFDQSDPEARTDLGLYALCGIRPSIITGLRVKDIWGKHRQLLNGKITLKKPTFVLVPAAIDGNKGNIDFLVIIPTRLGELLETQLNNRGVVTEESKLSTSNCTRTIFKRMKVIFSRVGFIGRPYMLRKYADTLMKAVGDYDLREFLMGHKGSISQIYEVTGISQEKEREYLNSYKPVDNKINTEIFGITSGKDMEEARVLGEFAKTFGVSPEAISAMLENLNKAPHEPGASTIEQYKDLIKNVIKQAQRTELRDMIREEIHNNHT